MEGEFHVRIRSAVPADAAILTAFARRTFIESYEDLNSPEDTRRHLDEFYFEQRQLEELTCPGMHTLLAEVKRDLVGFAQIEEAPVPQAVEDDSALMLKRYYVLKKYHGKGVAAPLLKAIIDHAGAQGSHCLWLTVWDQNPRAIAFYRKVGFRQVGITTFTVGTDVQDDILFKLDLV